MPPAPGSARTVDHPSRKPSTLTVSVARPASPVRLNWPTSPDASAWRRTVSMRCSTVTKLATASRPSTMPEQQRGVEQVGEERRHEHGDETVGALGDADVGRVTQPLGPRLGVGDDLTRG